MTVLLAARPLGAHHHRPCATAGCERHAHYTITARGAAAVNYCRDDMPAAVARYAALGEVIVRPAGRPSL